MGGGIVERIGALLRVVDPLTLCVGSVMAVAIFVLVILRQRLALFTLLLLCLTLQSIAIPALDRGSSLLRMYLLGVLALLAVAYPVHPGRAWVWYLGYPLFGFLTMGRSIDPLFSIQFGGLTMVTIVAAVSFAAYARNRQDIERLFVRIVFMAALWAILGTLSLRGLISGGVGGARYAGYFSSAGVYVQTGGILLPFCVWGTMRNWGFHWRVICAALTLLMVVVLVASGQRTGTFAGIIACAPLVVRRGLGKLVATVVIAALCGYLLIKLFESNQGQAAFVWRRFYSTSTSNRSLIWQRGLAVILDSPFWGHGLGMSGVDLKGDIQNAIHNMYLAIWFDSGLCGLACFIVSLFIASWQSLWLSFRARSQEVQNLGRLLLGTMVAFIAAGQFSTGASSPSDFFTVALLMTLVLTARLRQIDHDEVAEHQQRAMWIAYVQYAQYSQYLQLSQAEAVHTVAPSLPAAAPLS